MSENQKETKELSVVSPVNNSIDIARSPFEMMSFAVSQNIPMETIEKMMDLQERYDKNEAKKAFIAAMAEFKKEAIVITKDKVNSQFKGGTAKYTSLGNLVNTVLPIMSKHGFSHKWEIDQAENIVKITCIVTHSQGHSESVSMSAPPDKSGAKNPIQEIKSTRTYLQAATFESLMGLASTDANVDDDGNGASNDEIINHYEETRQELENYNTQKDVEDYCKDTAAKLFPKGHMFRAKFISMCTKRIEEINKQGE